MYTNPNNELVVFDGFEWIPVYCEQCGEPATRVKEYGNFCDKCAIKNDNQKIIDRLVKA